MKQNSFSNIGRLSRFILRLDRWKLSLWSIGLALFTIVLPPFFVELYQKETEIAALAETMANPAMTAMLGPGDLDHYTIGAMMAHQLLLFTAIFTGLMAILLVAGHTRGDEEAGRAEMIRSFPTGRLSYLNASLLVTGGAFLVLALFIGFGLYALGIESMDLEGSLLYGAALSGTGLVFIGVTAVFAQLTESYRGTIGWSIAFLLLAYLFRAVTDISNESLSWLSPLGWVSKAEVYSENHWGPIWLMVAAAVVLCVAANYLHSIRDLERGFIASKPGRSHASRFLQSPIGLALRLQRTSFIAWAVGLFVLGASYGSVFGDLETFFEGSEMYQLMLQQAEGVSIAEQFLPTLMLVMSLLAVIPPIMAMNKLRSEEKRGRLDYLVCRAVPRKKLFGSYLLLAVVHAFVMISLSVVGLWWAAAAVMEDVFAFETAYRAALVYFPAMLVMVGIAALLNGCLPRWTFLNWIYFVYSFFVLYLGRLIQLPDWAGKLSPFGHIPQVPVEEAAFMPLFLLTLIALLSMLLGLIGFHKRDIG